MFRRLNLVERRERRGTLNNNSLFLTLYTPLLRRRGEDLSPEEVWVEGNRLAVLLREESNDDSQIRIEQAFDDLCSSYEVFATLDGSREKRSKQQAEHSAMMVMLTAFLLLLNVYDKPDGHPYYHILLYLKSIIWEIPDCQKLYEEIRTSEDVREGRGLFIEVADFIEEIATQEEPLIPAQVEFACKRMEDFIKENKYCNLSTMVDNERMISRISDANNHCFQKPLELLRAEINSVRENLSGRSQDRINEHIDEMLARAIENCQQYFWGNSSYAVVFCVYRDVLNMKLNKSAFEKKVEELSYKKKRDYYCPAGTISNAFSDNPIFKENVDKWDNYNPIPRIVKLRDELRKELKL